jgi:N utilization substance protein A
MDSLDVEETIAQLLVAEGFADLDEVAYVELDELASIEGFDDDIAQELQNRARGALQKRDEEADDKRKQLGVQDDVAAIELLTPQMLVKLGEAGVKTLDDLAEFAGFELIESGEGPLQGFDLTEDDANAVIMAARAHWYDDEETPAAESAASED